MSNPFLERVRYTPEEHPAVGDVRPAPTGRLSRWHAVLLLLLTALQTGR